MTYNPENWLNIPVELQNRAQWMVCGDDKVPRSVKTGYPADNTNPYYWASFAEAYAYADRHGMWIGFCFSAGGGLACIDIDNKIDPQSDPVLYAENQERMRAMYRFYDSYIEQSKSANGLHIILKGEIGPGRRRDNVEVYSQERFMIMTGDVQKERPLMDGQHLLDSLVQQMTISDRKFVDLEEKPAVESDADVAKRILNSRSGGKFEDLIAPDWYARINPNSRAPYGDDPSRADLSFATLVGFFTESNGQIWSMFKQTALGNRLKNGQVRHPMYDRFLVHTIKEARAYLASDAGKRESVDLRGATDAMLERFKAERAANEAAQRAKIEDPAQSAALNWKPESDHQIVNKHKFVFKKPYEVSAEPPLEWALENVFQKRSVNAIYGWSAVGKSFVALDLMMAIAEGREWFGHETEQMHVTYLALEGGDGMRNRLEAYRLSRGIGYQLPTNFDIYRGHFNICDPEHVSAMIYQRQRDHMVGGMFVIDTFAKAIIGADENSSKEMGPAVQQAQLISEQLQACVVLVHHSTKPDKDTGIAGGLRGSGAIQAGIDGVLQVAKRYTEDESGNRHVTRVLVMDKVKEGQDAEEHPFELNVVKIGERVRKSGEIVDVTSCTIKDLAHCVNSPVAPIAGAGVAGGAPTYSAAEYAAGGAMGGAPNVGTAGNARAGTKGPTRARSAKASAEQKASRYNIGAVLDRALAIGADRVNRANMGKFGAPPDKHPTPREELVSIITDLINPDEVDNAFKTAVRNALNFAVTSGKLGRSTEHSKQYYWLM
jgi:hypothetical protein